MNREVPPSTGDLGDGKLCTLFSPRILARHCLLENCEQHLIGEPRNGRQKVLHLVSLVDFGVQHRLDFFEGRLESVDLSLEVVLGLSETLDFVAKACQCLGGGNIVMVDRWVAQLRRA